MQVVQIWSKTESLDGALDIFFDVRWRIGDAPISTIHAIETAFRSDCLNQNHVGMRREVELKLTEDFVADVVLPDELTQQLLVDSSSIYDLTAGKGGLASLNFGKSRRWMIHLQPCPKRCIPTRWPSATPAQPL